MSFTTTANELILDSFAGSGTTGHAVLKLNHADHQCRRFILVEMKPSIAREITAERLRRTARGFTNPKGENVAGLGGDFRFCTLDDPLFDECGNIHDAVRFPALARYVYFIETGAPLTRKARATSPLIGVHRGTAVYLLYNGILKDKSVDGGNVLTRVVFENLPRHEGPKVIYGTACRMSPSRLKNENIIFKQIPYEIRVR